MALLRSVDRRRIRRRVGKLTADEVRSVEEGVRLYLGSDRTAGHVSRTDRAVVLEYHTVC